MKLSNGGLLLFVLVLFSAEVNASGVYWQTTYGTFESFLNSSQFVVINYIDGKEVACGFLDLNNPSRSNYANVTGWKIIPQSKLNEMVLSFPDCSFNMHHWGYNFGKVTYHNDSLSYITRWY